jgi:hypothetical protein
MGDIKALRRAATSSLGARLRGNVVVADRRRVSRLVRGGRVTPNFAKEVGLLRTLAANLASMPPLTGLDRLRPQEFTRQRHEGRIVIQPPGRAAFIELSETIVRHFPAMERGTIFPNLQSELFTVLADEYVDRYPPTIGATEVSSLHDHFARWFEESAKPRRVFIPCFVSRWAAPHFSIGPVLFTFIEQFAQSEFYPRGDDQIAAVARLGFDQMLTLMRDSPAHWLACVQIEECERDRAQDVAALAVDLAIVALQLAAPAHGTRTMARLDARRGAANKFTLSEGGRPVRSRHFFDGAGSINRTRYT